MINKNYTITVVPTLYQKLKIESFIKVDSNKGKSKKQT